MKRFLGVCGVALVLGLASVVWADGYAQTFSLVDGTVVVSNGQANSSWVPVAVLFRYAGETSGTVSVRRASQGIDVPLDTRAFANASSVVWVATAMYPFALGDALILVSSATNGSVQVVRRGG